MNSPTATTIYNKLTKLDTELQRLKVDVYFSLPKQSRPKSLYDEDGVLEAARETREDIWQKRYAKKIARVS